MYNILIVDDEPAICEGLCTIIDWHILWLLCIKYCKKWR